MKKNIKNMVMIFLGIWMAFTLVSCTSNSNKEDNLNQVQNGGSITSYPYTITDSEGREITVEKEPQRIISITPNITELIYALGKEKELIGRTDYCDYPEEAKDIQSIGTLIDPNVEKIIELKPDLVIAATNLNEDMTKKLEDLGIKVIILYEEESFEGVYNSISTLGKILNTQEKAKDLVSTIQKKNKDIQEKVKDKEAPTIYYVVGFGKDGDYTATGDTFINQMIEMAGGENIAKDAIGWKYSLEKIIEKDPEYIVISKNFGMKEQFIHTAGYQELSAVKNNKVIEIDDNLISRQGPRLAEGVEALAKILHPDLF